MATLAKNNWFVTLSGVNVNAYITDVKINPKNKTQEVTAGANASHIQRAPGLDDYDYDVTIVWDDAVLASYLQQLKPGAVYILDCGPNGNAVGQPRMTQKVIVDSAPTEVQVDKSLVAFALKLLGADVPSNNLYAGATF